MSSDAKTAANRQNAHKSTGPRTERGKSKSRLNAVKSGIYAVTPILPGEDENAYREIEQTNLEHFAPVGPVENRLVRQMTTEEWKLMRIDRAEIALHMRLRDAQLVRFFEGLSDSDFVYVRSAYRDEFSDQLNQHRHQKEVANRDTTPGASYEDVDPAEYARNLDADEKNDVDARLNRVLQLDNIILAGMVRSTENAPQTRLDHERRATARAYFAYVAKLKEYQQERLTVTVTPASVVQIDAVSRTNARSPKRSPPNHAANQNHHEPDNKGTEKGAFNIRTRRQIRNDFGGSQLESDT